MRRATSLEKAEDALSRRPKVRGDLRTELLEGDMVLYVPQTGRAYLLNSTAASCWNRCNGSITVEALGRELAQQYGIDERTSLDDLSSLLAQFSRAGLLE